MTAGILFDLDGTLLNTLEDLWSAVNHTLRQYNCPPRSMEEVRRFVGNGAKELIRLSLPEKRDDLDLQAVLAAFRRYYDAHCQVKTRPYPGILEVLSALSKEYPLAVVSNKPDAAVKALGALYFPGLYALGDSPERPRKPAPDMLQHAMKILGVERCIYVGDSEVDVTTAKNANVPCLSVTWGFRDEDALKDAGATHFCRAPEALPEAIGHILAEI